MLDRLVLVPLKSYADDEYVGVCLDLELGVLSGEYCHEIERISVPLRGRRGEETEEDGDLTN